jgi:hypothetical protein
VVAQPVEGDAEDVLGAGGIAWLRLRTLDACGESE